VLLFKNTPFFQERYALAHMGLNRIRTLKHKLTAFVTDCSRSRFSLSWSSYYGQQISRECSKPFLSRATPHCWRTTFGKANSLKSQEVPSSMKHERHLRCSKGHAIALSWTEESQSSSISYHRNDVPRNSAVLNP